MQQKARFYPVLCVLLALLLAASLLWGIGRVPPSPVGQPPAEPFPVEQLAVEKPAGALFCWDWKTTPEESAALFSLMTSQGLDTLYQYVPSRAGQEEVLTFLRGAAGQNIRVYLLDGEPEWALDPEGEEMRAVIRRAQSYNDALTEGETGFSGVLLDVEPYLAEEWKKDPYGVMDCYAKAMKQAYGTARRRGLTLIACLPYDLERYAEALTEVVYEGCDALAIMNYSREDEIGQLRLEAALCAAAQKPLVAIYELQPAGEHGLQESNTYHGVGLAALRQSVAALRESYPRQVIGYALHHEESLQELLSAEN